MVLYISFFQAAEKRLSHCVVPAVAFPGHALDACVFAQAFPEAFGGILDSSVAVDDKPLRWIPQINGFFELIIIDTAKDGSI